MNGRTSYRVHQLKLPRNAVQKNRSVRWIYCINKLVGTMDAVHKSCTSSRRPLNGTDVRVLGCVTANPSRQNIAKHPRRFTFRSQSGACRDWICIGHLEFLMNSIQVDLNIQSFSQSRVRCTESHYQFFISKWKAENPEEPCDSHHLLFT